MNEQRRRRKPRRYGKERWTYLIPDTLSTIASAAEKLYRHQNIRLALRCMCALIGAVLILTALPAAVKDTAQKAANSNNRPENPFGNDPLAPLTAIVIYSPDDDWGKDEAEYLATQLKSRFYISAVTVTDDQYLAAVKDQQTSHAELVITLGYTDVDANTSLSTNNDNSDNNSNSYSAGNENKNVKPAESYLDALARLGRAGVEITPGNRNVSASVNVNITAFEAASARRGSEHLLSAIDIKGASFSVSDELYITEISDTIEKNTVTTVLTDKDTSEVGKSNVLVVSYPDADEHSLNSLRLLLENNTPDLVIFNGGLDCGADGRTELASSWKSITDLLSSYNVAWGYNFTHADSKLPRDLVNEVLSSFSGCITSPDSNGSVTSTLALMSSDGIPFAAVSVVDIIDTTNADSAHSLCNIIETQTALVRRAGKNVAYTAVIPGVLPMINILFSGHTGTGGDITVTSTLSSYLLSYGADIYDTFISCGVNFFVCAAGTTDTGVITFNNPNSNPNTGSGNTSVTATLNGSIGFMSPGLGGKFDLNNSLRGASCLTFQLRRAGYIDVSLNYNKASALLLN